MTTAPLDIKVVYSASGKTVPRAPRPARGVSRAPGPAGLALLLGLLNIGAAASLTWFGCWKLDRELYLVMMLKTPAIEMNQTSATLFLPPPGMSPQADAARQDPMPAPLASPPKTSPTFVGKTARIVIGATRFAWPALAALTAAMLAFSGGLAWGRAGGPTVRVLCVLLFLAAAAYVTWQVYGVLMEYGRSYQPRHARMAMSAAVLLAGLLGAGIGRGAASWARWAAILLVVLGLASVVGIYLGRLCDAIPIDYAWLARPTGFLAAFAVFAAYAVVLYPLAGRLRTR